MSHYLHKARKRFGQNFLQDRGIIAQILRHIAIRPQDLLVEIGPGQGALTLPLAQTLSKIYAIEIDRDLQKMLLAMPALEKKLQLLCADALTVDFRQWGPGLRVVGNLPYNISTPLLLHLLGYADCLQDMHFMLQKEVVERITAAPGSKNWGRLSMLCQYFCETESLLEVPAQAFEPAPKVTSALLRLIPKNLSPQDIALRSRLEKCTAKGFGMRRKTLANNFKGICSAAELQALGIDARLRPEQLPLEDWLLLTKSFF